MPKGDSGIRRGGGASVNTSNMSNEDIWAVERYQRDIEEENKYIPSFVNSRMSEQEIREALIAEVQRTGQNIEGVSPATFDNRFPDAKDSRFSPLIEGLNATRSYPEMFIYDRFIPGHDELYEVRQVVPDKFDSSTLRLSFRGSSSPNSQYESVHLATWRGWGAKNIQDVKEILGMGEKITIIPSGSVNWPKYAVNVKKTQGLQDYMPE